MLLWSLAITAAASPKQLVPPGADAIEDAIGDCSQPCTLVLLAGQAYPDPFEVPTGKDVTLEAGGAAVLGPVRVTGGALILRDPTFDGLGESAVVVESGTLELERPAVLSTAQPIVSAALLRVEQGVVEVTGGAIEGLVAEDGGAIEVLDGTVTIDGTDFRVNVARSGHGGAIAIRGGTVTVRNAEFFGNSAYGGGGIGEGGAIANLGGTLVIENSSFSENSAATGGAISSHGALTVTGSSFEDNLAIVSGAGIGGAIATAPAAVVTVTGSFFDSNLAGFAAGALFLNASDTTIEDSTFQLNSIVGTFPRGGGAIMAQGGILRVARTRFTDDGSDEPVYFPQALGGAILSSALTTVTDSRFDGTHAAFGGAIALGENPNRSTLERNAYCNTRAIVSGGAILVEDGSATVSHSVFLTPRAEEGGALAVYDADVDVHNLTLRGPIAVLGPAVAAAGTPVDLSALIVFQVDRAPFRGQVEVDGAVVHPPLSDYGPVDAALITEVAIGWLGGPDPVAADPWVTCDDREFRIHPESPQFASHDGIDFGAFGDVTVPGVPWLADRDGDGVPWIYDCAEDDPTMHGFAVEWCNARDDDCDDEQDERPTRWALDGDGDGFGVETSRCVDPGVAVVPLDPLAVDCDDDEPSIHPGAPDAPGDGIDQDCDGGDGPGSPTGGTPGVVAPPTGPFRLAAGRCGCGTGGAEPASGLLPLLLLLALLGATRRAPAR